MTVKASRRFQTPMGIFSYTHLALPYYAYGIQQTKLFDNQFAIVATPEKALCDKVVITSGLQLRNEKNVISYLIDDLRMDNGNLKGFNTKAMLEWVPHALKKESLLMMIKTINNL